MGLLRRLRRRHGIRLAPGRTPSLPFAHITNANASRGPYLYSLYRDEHLVPPHLIPPLFTTGFLSGALSATITGSLADRYGRRTACLSFTLISSLSCALTTIPSLPCLFAGRVLGGVATSLLFSVFESWMVSDFRARRLGSKGLDLGRTFGVMSTVNSVVAIGAGVGSEWVVGVAGTRTAPFGVCVGVLGVAAVFIYTQWVRLPLFLIPSGLV
ncbi:MFS transporter [Candidatus Bathyarchaeota archaeon]|nr:MFS transporter [Candidatus Bathyarchaeota archaeon]